MPTIPIYQAELQQRTDEPFRVTNTDIARASGEAIASFGKGVEKYGEIALAKEQIAIKTKNQNDLMEMSGEIDRLVDNVYNDTILLGSSDGTDMTGLFEKTFEKSLSQYINSKKNVDPSVLGEVRARAIGWSNQKRADIMNKAREKFFQYTEKNFNNKMSELTGRVFLEPSEHDARLNEYLDYVNSSAMTPDQKFVANNLAKKSFADNYINGALSRAGTSENEYKNLEGLVVTKFASSYTDKEREAIINDIRSTRLKKLDANLKQEKETTAALKQKKEMINKEYYEMRLEEYENIFAMSDYDKNKSAAIDKFRMTLLDDHSNGDLEGAQINYLLDGLKQKQGEVKSRNSTQYWSRLTSGDDLVKLRNDVINDKANLTPSDATSLLRAIKAEEKLSKKKKKGVGPDKEQVKLGVKIIEDSAPTDLTGFRKPEDENHINYMLSKYRAELKKDPRDPVGIAERVLSENPRYFKTGEKARKSAAPGRAEFLLETYDPKEAVSKIKLMKDRGDMSDEEYIEALEKAKNIMKQKKKIKDRKDGAAK